MVFVEGPPWKEGEEIDPFSLKGPKVEEIGEEKPLDLGGTIAGITPLGGGGGPPGGDASETSLPPHGWGSGAAPAAGAAIEARGFSRAAKKQA